MFKENNARDQLSEPEQEDKQDGARWEQLQRRQAYKDIAFLHRLSATLISYVYRGDLRLDLGTDGLLRVRTFGRMRQLLEG